MNNESHVTILDTAMTYFQQGNINKAEGLLKKVVATMPADWRPDPVGVRQYVSEELAEIEKEFKG